MIRTDSLSGITVLGHLLSKTPSGEIDRLARIHKVASSYSVTSRFRQMNPIDILAHTPNYVAAFPALFFVVNDSAREFVATRMLEELAET